ncbi:reticulon-like protein B21 isoform X2 [Ananas comosus]|uniref:Reticulon-like protein n=1 Tax=Ananas comosus TaxID=4615 RepID=A0A6P5GCZ0_ANACO|nr:reticulon-like protein B21 isoform X2 [Ananas comosus]
MQGTSGNSSNNNNSTRRRRAITRNGVVVRSVWETRMKMDEVQGGIKVFNAGECDANAADEEGLRVYRRLRRNQSDGAAAAERKKRRSWSTSGNGPVALRKSPSEVSNSQKASAAEKQVLLICDGKGEEEEEEVVEEEKKERFDDKEMDQPLEKPKNSEEEEGVEEAEEEEEEEKEINKIHEIPMSPKVKNNAELDSETIKTPQEPIRSLSENKSDPMVDCRDLNPEPVKSPQEKKLVVAMNQRAINPEPSPEKKKPEPVIIRRATKPVPTKSPPVEFYDNEVHENIGANHNKMQNIVDLVMWRDVSKSAFVFGLGTFSLISSSYAKDLNFCLISSISYLGLVYLALMFLYKSILRRGEGVECDEESYCMVGEEEAIWVVRLLLPYINELLLKLRALFSGDPATTMKLALLLFALARCGSSVTVWTLAKLGFFGVFTVPKVCSSYSIQLARYGKFWLERVRDGWESCTHKKAVAAAAFTLIWNVSSTVARIWAVFMLVVAIKLYQQRIADEWSSREEEVAEEGAEDFRKEPSPVEIGRGTKIKRRL